MTTSPDPTCDVCRKPFTRFNSMQRVCGKMTCLKRVGPLHRKAEKAKDRATRERLKKRGAWMAEAQQAFNSWIRARDAGLPCICCGEPFSPDKPGGSVDAGHYLSRGSAPHLRFNENNCHAQRKGCNRPGGTTRMRFRAGMIARIGPDSVEALEADQSSAKWTIAELKAIRDDYRLRIKA